MIDANQPMTSKQLREFGIVTGLMFLLIFALIFPGISWLRKDIWYWAIWPWYVFGVLGLWALVHPASLIAIYRPWMKLAGFLGFINTRIIMTILFYIVLMPIGLVMRLFGHDPMRLKLDKTTSSYRQQRDKRDPHHMERPF